jgi:hypothetical protein
MGFIQAIVLISGAHQKKTDDTADNYAPNPNRPVQKP